jgi:hypothetical protein
MQSAVHSHGAWRLSDLSTSGPDSYWIGGQDQLGQLGDIGRNAPRLKIKEAANYGGLDTELHRTGGQFALRRRLTSQ